jgi:type IV pilus biogenesis protein CpaD/CtpE
MSKLITVVLAAAAVMLAGCEDLDPYHRQDVWYPSGATQANLAAQVANPYDMVRGHGVSTSDGELAAAAVTRARQDHVKPLLNPNSTGGGGGGGGGSSGGGATGG